MRVTKDFSLSEFEVILEQGRSRIERKESKKGEKESKPFTEEHISFQITHCAKKMC